MIQDSDSCWAQLREKKDNIIYLKCRYCQNEERLREGYEAMAFLNKDLAEEGYASDFVALVHYECDLVAGGQHDD